MVLHTDALRHAFGFLSVAGLWNARQVCACWLAASRGCRGQTKVSLRDLFRCRGMRLAVRELVVLDEPGVRVFGQAPDLRTDILTLEFDELTDEARVTFGCLLDTATVARELRFNFAAVDERCDEENCDGNLCQFFRAHLPKFRHCLVEVPWTLDGYMNRHWCYANFSFPLVAGWRLRGGRNDHTWKVRPSSAFFAPDCVRCLVLEGISFQDTNNARELANLRESHTALREVLFVNCVFPAVLLWDLYFGRDVFDSWRVAFHKCQSVDFRQVYSDIKFLFGRDGLEQ